MHRGERYSISSSMEGALTARDRVGVQDFVLLEDHKSETAFVANLKKRYKQKLIYTYIGPVLVSVNPYQQLSFYSKYSMEKYQGVNFYEMPPHVYAISDNAYRAMRNESRDQCVLISGESGSGKTEASKFILQHLSVSSATSGGSAEQVKNRLLQLTPILEAFGNAKTHRNDNSSRFGKYMDVQFDFRGSPVGGNILNYLLEKSRVVHQAQGERNFHVFYQLLAGGDDDLLKRLVVDRQTDNFFYINQGKCAKVTSVNDKRDFKQVQDALKVLDFSPQTVEVLFAVVASILHLGNVSFVSDDDGNARVEKESVVRVVASLLGCGEAGMVEALTHRTIEANREKVHSPLTVDQANYARDAVAKAIYGRVFDWLVQYLNRSITNQERSRKNIIGLLDIYGFEIFRSNSFEQFCINYCNEKLQQLFIELTLKQEQEEYRAEGIAWETVEYFNNKVICDLIEERHRGIIDILDEECLRPGDPTDHTFLAKLQETVGKHEHFVTHALADAKTRKTMGYDEFRLMHYAGSVTYNVNGFMDKNNDLLYRNLKEVMSQSSNDVISDVFPREELNRLKRPETVGTQFRSSLNQLMEILMSKEPSYVRCIKPNDAKSADRFDDTLVRHQVKYLGLMENLRVRRAGFAYRRSHEAFLKRYKSLCPETWPKYEGSDRDGVEALVRSLEYQDTDYRMGKTKIFIRFPKTLFATEDQFQARKHELATQIQSLFRGWRQARAFRRMRRAVTLLSANWRRVLAVRLRARRRDAADAIRKFVLGFMTRHRPRCDENANFLDYVRHQYLVKCKQHLPTSVLDRSWPRPPAALEQTSELLREINMRNMTRKYVLSCTAQRQAVMREKVLASAIFREKKAGYEASVARPFQAANSASPNNHMSGKMLAVIEGGEKVQYSCHVTKYDRHGYQPRPRVLVVTATACYLFETKTGKLKQRIAHHNLTGISTSSLRDDVMVIHTAPPADGQQEKAKGDVIIQSNFVIETVTKLATIAKKDKDVKIVDNQSIKHAMTGGKEGVIDYVIGDHLSVKKSKTGSLLVVVPR